MYLLSKEYLKLKIGIYSYPRDIFSLIDIISLLAKLSMLFIL